MVATPIPEIAPIVAQLRKTFDSNVTKSISWRRGQLEKLHRFLVDKFDLVCETMYKDNRKAPGVVNGEFQVLLGEIAKALENLDEWTRPVSHFELVTATDRAETRSEPVGVVLVVGAWNFPLQLLLAPMIAAIAAGNCVCLKPSEVSVHMEAFILEWIPKILDPSAIKVVAGGIPETTKLLEHRFDKIFYTGNGTVGKIIMTAASKHLTPVVLELGGKSPVYIHADANVEVAAARVAWAKTMNCGQVCLAPDYLLVHKDVYAKFIEALKRAIIKLFGDNPKTTTYERIINQAHTKRLSTVLQRQLKLGHSKLEVGGDFDVDTCYLAPTVVSGVKMTDPLMEDEIFGPMIGAVIVENENEAISLIKSRERPLGLYIFSESKQLIEKFSLNTSSGSITANDFYINMLIRDMPFGGVGSSGIGAYHGKNGFDAFSHKRGFIIRGTDFVTETVHSLFYPPLGSKRWVINTINFLLVKKPPTAFTKALGKLLMWAGRLGVLAIALEIGKRVGGVEGVWTWFVNRVGLFAPAAARSVV